MSTTLEELATAEQIRAELDISPATYYRWLSLGMPSHQPSGPRGRRLFDRDEVAEWVKSRCFAKTGEGAA